MSTRDSTTDAPNRTDGSEAEPGQGTDPGDDDPPDPAAETPLAATVVRYSGEPDRLTIYPPGASSVSRMSTWLTADAGACVDLQEHR